MKYPVRCRVRMGDWFLNNVGWTAQIHLYVIFKKQYSLSSVTLSLHSHIQPWRIKAVFSICFWESEDAEGQLKLSTDFPPHGGPCRNPKLFKARLWQLEHQLWAQQGARHAFCLGYSVLRLYHDQLHVPQVQAPPPSGVRTPWAVLHLRALCQVFCSQAWSHFVSLFNMSPLSPQYKFNENKFVLRTCDDIWPLKIYSRNLLNKRGCTWVLNHMQLHSLGITADQTICPFNSIACWQIILGRTWVQRLESLLVQIYNRYFIYQVLNW